MNSMTIFSKTAYNVLGTMPLTLIEPRGLDFTPDGAEGYVVMSQSNAVIRFNAATRTELGTITVGSTPEEIVIFDLPPAGVTNWLIH